MRYRSLPSPEQLAIVTNWLIEGGPLFVDDYHAHYGGASPQYFIRSINDLLDLIARGSWPDRMLSVFRRLYPLRGIANEELLGKALSLIRDDEAYSIFFTGEEHCYPSMCQQADGGYKGHADLRRDLQQFEVVGRLVAVGPCPFNGDDTWIYSSPDVFRLDLQTAENEVV